MDDFTVNSFCSLCGVLVEPHDGTPVDESNPLTWNQQVRAVRTKCAYHDAFITRSGWLNSVREVISYNPDLDADPDNPWVAYEVHAFGGRTRDYWCFPMHEVCWQILRSRLDTGGQPIDEGRIAHHLFAILYNTPTTGTRMLLPGHDYAGAALFQSPFNPPANVNRDLYTSKFYYLQHDPNDDFDFTLGKDEGRLIHDLSTLSLSDTGGPGDIFQELPSEIIMLILQYLPTRSIGKLRLASRSVAAASRPALLPQSFWSSRFSGEHEMAFAFANRTDVLPEDPINWRRLYDASKGMLKKPWTYPGFMNRHRIWQSLDPIVSVLKLRLSNEAGISKRLYEDSSGLHWSLGSPMASSEFMKSAEHERGEILGPEAGSRLLETQLLNWSRASDVDHVVLAVSTIHHTQRTFITGMRLLCKDNASGCVELDRAGFISTTDEELIDIPRNSALLAVRVRVVMQGIIGLCLDFWGSNGAIAHKVADFGCTDEESGVSEFQSKADLRHTKWLVGLDAFKIVSLRSYHEDWKDAKNTSLNNEGPPDDTISHADAWSSNVPLRCNPAWTSPVPFPQQSFNLCVHADFGGVDGKLLKSLAMVNVFMGMYPQVFFGFSFVYRDGSERDFGRKSYHTHKSDEYSFIVQSFPIAGEDGEVIDAIKTSYSQADDAIQGLSIRTNFNRSKAFRLFGTESYSESFKETVITASRDQLITGFFLKLKSPSGHIRDLAVDYADGTQSRSEECSNQAIMSLSAKPKHLSSAEEILAHTGDFAFGAADVAGLRRIHFSRGRGAGSSREPLNISGLRLEYADERESVIIGQWFDQSDTLEFDADERIVSVTTWHDIVNKFSRVKLGPFTYMYFETSKGKTLGSVPKTRPHDTVPLRYRENPYEQISTITWGYNWLWDHARFLYVPKAGRSGLELAPISRSIPSWKVQEKIFVNEVDEEGNADPMVAIELTYKALSDEPSAITFLYRSGNAMTMGDRGERPVVQELQDGEKLTRLDIAILRAKRLGAFVFHTDRDRELTLAHEDQHARAVNHVQGWESHQLRPDIPCKEDANQKFDMTKSCGEFVGMWALPSRKDGYLKYAMFGPIFESVSVSLGEGRDEKST